MSKKCEIEEELYGHSDVCTGEVALNVQIIWEDTQKEDTFIELFASTYTHETLHITIFEILMDIMECGEEKLIRSLLGEEWTPEMHTYYRCTITKKEGRT